MAGKGKAFGAAIKYGPLIATAAQKYGPQVVDQLRAQREPAERFVQDQVAKGNQRKKALQHAATVVQGSVLQVFHQNRAHWIVYSQDEPIAVHPPTPASYEVLTRHADLTTRIRPGKGLHLPHLPRPHRRDGAPGSTSGRRAGRTPAAADVRYHDDDDRPRGELEEGGGPPRADPPGSGAQRPTA